MDTSITDLVKDNEVNISNLEEYNIDDIDLNDNNGDNDQYINTSKWIVWKKELLSVLSLVGPIILTYGSDYFMNLIQLMFIGHIADDDDSTLLAGAALGISYCNVTGFSVVLGLLSALDTLISQAYGAKNNHLIGRAIHQSIIVLFFVCFLAIMPLWIFAKQILLFIGQDEGAVSYASQYIKIMSFAIIPFTIYSILRRFLQNQNVAVPLMISGFISIGILTISMIFTVIVFEMGFIGVPIAQVITNIISSIVLFIYTIWNGSYKLFFVKITKETLSGLITWLKLGIAGMFMVCAEWWGFEINILISGLIDNDSLAAMTLLLSVQSLVYTIPFGISVSATTRVGNALGSKNIDQVKLVSKLVLIIAIVIQSISAIILISTCKIWVKLFTKDKAIIDIVVHTVPLLGLFTLMDAIQVTLAGILRGAGKQIWGASIYLISFYVIGLTCSLVLVFVANLDLLGLWLGISLAVFSSMIMLGIYFKFGMNWEILIEEASKRVSENNNDENNEEEEIIEMEAFLEDYDDL